MRHHALLASVFVAAACCVLVADIASHRAARVVLDTMPHEDNVNWLWKQGPAQAVTERNNKMISTDKPRGTYLFFPAHCISIRMDTEWWMCSDRALGVGDISA
jgi:hypothetical protein